MVLLISTWNATIIFEKEDLSVVWENQGEETKRLFLIALVERMLKMQFKVLNKN